MDDKIIIESFVSCREKKTEYVRKKALLDWAKKEEAKLDSGIASDGFRLALTMLREKINSL